MRRFTPVLTAAFAALALTASAAVAQGPADRTTFVTFSGPVSVPGMTLPAGTYTFRLADSQTDRHIVQIFDREGSKLFTTLLAVPAERPKPEGDPVITFKETPSDRPPAVHYWYYAGEKAGNELVYPKSQAIAIARASGEPVMSVDSSGSSIDDWKSGTVSQVTADTATDQQPAPTAPAAAPVTTTPPAATVPPPSVSDTRPAPMPENLPHTASTLPLVGLLGLLALVGGLAVHAARTA